MITTLIRWSIQYRFLVLLMALLLSLAGFYALRGIALDAIPDLSDVQVIIRTPYAGQAPQIIEDQITYPLSTAMLSVPRAKAVRGYSFFGDSYVYVIFSDDTDVYWARSRVLEYLNQVSGLLPKNVQPQIGPDATGVGWVYQYALVDKTHQHDLAQLRSLQDWFLKYELQTVEGVAEVAAIGGMVKQYQVEIDPDKLRGYELSLANVKKGIENSNQEQSASVLEIAEAEYRIRIKGYIKNLEDVKLISIPITQKQRLAVSSVLLDDISDNIHIGSAMRRGIADLNGEGEVVGGIVVMRSGENALSTIQGVKAKLAQLQKSLPQGVEIVEIYNRAILIGKAINTLSWRLIEELIIVVIVCALFLYHLRSSLVVLISLPVGILAAFVMMSLQGINANIMSLGGIAIAIGAMVDATIVMIENVHKHIENAEFKGELDFIPLIEKAAIEVGKPLFFSLLIITLSFMPVFALEGQEAKLFSPLAYTKTYAMAAAAILSITLVPALMAYFIRGKIHSETDNPINRVLITLYKPLMAWVLNNPKITLIAVLLLSVSSIIPYSQTGSEFMPEMDEGDLLYMPTTLPAISIGKARQLLQQTDRLIKTHPEVVQVFGKLGRADTATDPAPLTMLETLIKLKDPSEWREGMTLKKIISELDERVNIPSLRNAWLKPIRARIDMQSTGINTPIGIKVSGENLETIAELGQQIEFLLHTLTETKSVYSERTTGGRYIDIDINRYALVHYGLSMVEMQDAISIAIGGVNITQSVEGRERYSVNLRYPQKWRDSITKLKQLPIVALEDTHIQLQDIAELSVVDGPPMIKSENGRINSWVYITAKSDDIGGYVQQAQALLDKELKLPAGYILAWSGQYTYMERVKEKLFTLIPVILLVIFILLYFSFSTISDVLMIMFAIPVALVGGIWMLWCFDYHLSVAVGIGFIALAGVATEFGVLMLIYLQDAVKAKQPQNPQQLREAVIYGAVQRVRPKAMTVAVIIAGLMPIFLGSGTGSETMQRIAAPMIGGMITAPLVSMLVVPLMFYLQRKKQLFSPS